MFKLYPTGRAYKHQYLRVSPLHRLYIEQAGNPKGIPVVHLHGGPGSASKRKYRKFYNPEKYHIILFDQRGCGKSKPLGELRENTTWDLVSDMEKIRKHLKIDKWVVSGGSWGSTLALAYAQKYPEKVTALLVRGIFTFRKLEVDWWGKEGVGMIYPEEYEKYVNHIPPSERGDLITAYGKRILGNDKKEAMETAKVAYLFEGKLLSLKPPKKEEEKYTEKDFVATKIFFHYAVNGGFLREGQLLKEASKLKNIPGVIIQGRYDMDCPVITAWELHKVWPKAALEITFAGHLGNEKENAKKLVEYTDRLANSGKLI